MTEDSSWLRVLIVDDEDLARERLKRMLEEIANCEVCGEAGNGVEALECVSSLEPDVVLLDIRMPGMDGLEAAGHLSKLEQPPAIIFTTAYGDHALEAFEAEALAYLMKPVRQEKLANALSRAAVLSARNKRVLAQSTSARTHISALVGGNIRLIPVEEVRYFLADQKYVSVVSADGEVPIEESLKALEEEFGDSVLRVHRNALVSMRYVTGLVKDESGAWVVTVEGVDEGLAVSRRALAAVRARLRGD